MFVQHLTIYKLHKSRLLTGEYRNGSQGIKERINKSISFPTRHGYLVPELGAELLEGVRLTDGETYLHPLHQHLQLHRGSKQKNKYKKKQVFTFLHKANSELQYNIQIFYYIGFVYRIVRNWRHFWRSLIKKDKFPTNTTIVFFGTVSTSTPIYAFHHSSSVVNYFQYAESYPAVFATESVCLGAALRTARSLIGSGIIFYCWFPIHNTYVHCTYNTARVGHFFKDKNRSANGDLL